MPNQLYNLRAAEETFRRHKFSLEHQLRIIKIGPEPYNSRILRGIHYVTSASVPGMTIEAKEIPFAGIPLRYPGNLNYTNEMTISFRTAQTFLVRNALEQWMFDIRNPLEGGGQYCRGSEDTLQLAITNDAGRIIRGYELIGAWPSSLGDIAYNNESDNPTTFDVTFTYSYWCPLPLDGLNLEDDFNNNEQRSVDKGVIYDQYEEYIQDKETSAVVDCE